MSPILNSGLVYLYALYKLRVGLYYDHLDPSENRARRFETSEELAEKYQGLITLPVPSIDSAEDQPSPRVYDWSQED